MKALLGARDATRKLKAGGSGKKVKNRKQAIAIALNEAGVSKKKRKARRP